MKREFSAGGVVYKKSKKSKLAILWLVAKSAASDLYPKSYGRLPKGWLDDTDDGKSPGPLASGERKAGKKDLQQAALREVREEGGIEAIIIKKLETQRFFYTREGQRVMKFVTYYLMEWQADLPEGPGYETEEVVWLPYKAARKALKHSGEKKVLDKALTAIEAGVQDSLI